MPRISVRAKVPHTEQMAVYEGVLLGHVLQEAGIQPFGKSPLQNTQKAEMARPLRSAYVLIEAADGYRVVFSLAEVFPEPGGPKRGPGRSKEWGAAGRQDGAHQVVVPDSARYRSAGSGR